MNNLQEKLKNLIEKSGLSQREIARRSNISPSSLSSYIKGYYIPKQDTVDKLATVLSCTPEYLLGYDPQELNLSESEKKIIKKYRTDKNFKSILDTLLKM